MRSIILAAFVRAELLNNETEIFTKAFILLRRRVKFNLEAQYGVKSEKCMSLRMKTMLNILMRRDIV